MKERRVCRAPKWIGYSRRSRINTKKRRVFTDHMSHYSHVINHVTRKENKMAAYVPVVLKEDDEPVELPTEDDGTLLLSVVQSQFEGASGLKFR